MSYLPSGDDTDSVAVDTEESDLVAPRPTERLSRNHAVDLRGIRGNARKSGRRMMWEYRMDVFVMIRWISSQ
jgi:hypothetical protein